MINGCFGHAYFFFLQYTTKIQLVVLTSTGILLSEVVTVTFQLETDGAY